MQLVKVYKEATGSVCAFNQTLLPLKFNNDLTFVESDRCRREETHFIMYYTIYLIDFYFNRSINKIIL